MTNKQQNYNGEIGSLLPVSTNPLLRQRGELLHEGAGAGKREDDLLIVIDVRSAFA